jgi:hypothetical protein
MTAVGWGRLSAWDATTCRNAVKQKSRQMFIMYLYLAEQVN